MKPVTDFFQRNWGGLLASCIIAVFFYALTAWLKNTVAQQMVSYVPIQVWTQWSQERGEWRGEVEARVTALEKGQTALRFEIIDRLEKLSTAIQVLQTLVNERTLTGKPATTSTSTRRDGGTASASP